MTEQELKEREELVRKRPAPFEGLPVYYEAAEQWGKLVRQRGIPGLSQSHWAVQTNRYDLPSLLYQSKDHDYRHDFLLPTEPGCPPLPKCYQRDIEPGESYVNWFYEKWHFHPGFDVRLPCEGDTGDQIYYRLLVPEADIDRVRASLQSARGEDIDRAVVMGPDGEVDLVSMREQAHKLKFGRPYGEPLVDAASQHVCPRCHKASTTRLQADSPCTECGFPGLKDLPTQAGDNLTLCAGRVKNRFAINRLERVKRRALICLNGEMVGKFEHRHSDLHWLEEACQDSIVSQDAELQAAVRAARVSIELVAAVVDKRLKEVKGNDA